MWHVLDFLRDAFILSRSPVFEITHTSHASVADRILGFCMLIKDVAPVYTLIYSGDSLLKTNLHCFEL